MMATPPYTSDSSYGRFDVSTILTCDDEQYLARTEIATASLPRTSKALVVEVDMENSHGISIDGGKESAWTLGSH